MHIPLWIHIDLEVFTLVVCMLNALLKSRGMERVAWIVAALGWFVALLNLSVR